MGEIYKEPNPEKKQSKEEEQKEQDAQYEQWMKDHPETVLSQEKLRECEPEIEEFEELLKSFESEYSLEALLLINDLTPKEAPKHPIREPAKNALIPIWAKLSILEKETNISLEKYEELKAKYKRLSRAVGIINKNNKVDHTR